MNLSASFPRLGALALAAAAAVVSALPAQAETLVGLTTTNALLTFDSASPTNGSALATITGLQVLNERILGIDLRPTTGVIYGVSSEDRVYSLTTGGIASFVGMLTTPLGSDVVGIDFNPVADLAGMASLRIVSSTGQNYAFNVAGGVTTLATAVQTGFGSVAYSNNDRDPATATSLYYIDTAADVLKVATANFNAPTITTVGPLGFNVNGVNGFDISSTGTSFAALTDLDTGKSGLYTVNLASGAATFAGLFGIGGNTAIAPALLGLTATTLAAAVPEPSTYALMVAGLLGVGWATRRKQAR